MMASVSSPERLSFHFFTGEFSYSLLSRSYSSRFSLRSFRVGAYPEERIRVVDVRKRLGAGDGRAPFALAGFCFAEALPVQLSSADGYATLQRRVGSVDSHPVNVVGVCLKRVAFTSKDCFQELHIIGKRLEQRRCQQFDFLQRSELWVGHFAVYTIRLAFVLGTEENVRLDAGIWLHRGLGRAGSALSG